MIRLEMLEINAEQWYIIYKSESDLYIEVASRSFAVERIIVKLTELEILRYRDEGFDFTDGLARTISFRPSEYVDRQIAVKDITTNID